MRKFQVASILVVHQEHFVYVLLSVQIDGHICYREPKPFVADNCPSLISREEQFERIKRNEIIQVKKNENGILPWQRLPGLGNYSTECQRKTFSVLKNDYKYSLTILVETQRAVNDGLLTYHYNDHFSKPSTSNILQEARY